MDRPALTILYNISVASRPVFEHHFPPPEITRICTKEGIAVCTHAVFFGSPAPSPEVRVPGCAVTSRGGAWWIGFLCWHWPLQAVFCPYPAQVHDLHHRHPGQPLSPDHLYARQLEIAAGVPGWPAYTEIWGLATAIDQCFRAMNEARQEPQDPQALESNTGQAGAGNTPPALESGLR